MAIPDGIVERVVENKAALWVDGRLPERLGRSTNL